MPSNQYQHNPKKWNKLIKKIYRRPLTNEEICPDCGRTQISYRIMSTGVVIPRSKGSLLPWHKRRRGSIWIGCNYCQNSVMLDGEIPNWYDE